MTSPYDLNTEDAIYDAAVEHDDGYNVGQSSYTDPPLNAYDNEPIAMDDEYNAGQSSYTDPPPSAYDDEPVAMDDEPANYAPPAPDHRQKDVEGVTLTRISHMLKEDEFQFTDKKHHTGTTVRSDWTKGKFDGRSGYWYSGRKTDYFTRYKF
ncbi:hypothetical protein EG329_009452 [Mollisiaceae sp. DMI_Dod_QoI]|nr:hypothetical protein EG329_009452 [Helotiales sp. DMI_Dod_QoI]